MDYYNNHLPMVQEKLGAELKFVAVEQALSAAEAGSPATYLIMCHFSFDSVEAFQSVFGPHAETILGDISNYTDVQPTIQTSEVKM